MKTVKMRETGITSTVITEFSRYSILNLIEIICDKKISGIISWIEKKKVKPQNFLIIGSYLTGMRLANYLCDSSFITVLDIHPHLQGFLNPSVNFVTDYSQIITHHFDVIIDTSGIGGINPDTISRFRPSQVFIVEDPCSDGSDEYTRSISHSADLLQAAYAKYRGALYTSGLHSKTSGTMTLTLEVIKKSMDEAQNQEGVLYSSSHIDFFERILFKEKDQDTFFHKLAKPALVVSTLKEFDINEIIENNLSKIESKVVTGVFCLHEGN